MEKNYFYCVKILINRKGGQERDCGSRMLGTVDGTFKAGEGVKREGGKIVDHILKKRLPVSSRAELGRSSPTTRLPKGVEENYSL